MDKKVRQKTISDIQDYIDHRIRFSIHKEGKRMKYRDYREEIYNLCLGYIDFAYWHNLITKKDRSFFLDVLFEFFWYE